MRIIPPKRSAVPRLDDMSWWAIYWAIHSHIAQSGTRLEIPATGPQIWGHLLTKNHIWRISEDYPAKTKLCTTFWTTCRGELYIELSIAIWLKVVHGFKFRSQVPKSGVTYWRKITFDGLVRIISPKRSAVPLLWRHVVVSYILSYPKPYSSEWYTASNSGHRSPNLGSLLRKYQIWRISEDYPAKTKRCTTFWTTCRGELYIELSIAI